VSKCGCGGELPPYRGRGAPRKRCEECAADKSSLGKAWRAAHPSEVDAYNVSRLSPYGRTIRQAVLIAVYANRRKSR
jgi:hypothetical protein